MTLPYSPSRAVYQGNGAATAFPFAFKVWNTDQLGVSLTSPDGSTTPAQGWSASLGENGGTVTYLHNGAPLPAGWRLAIVRDMPFAQGIDLVSASRFDPQVIEDGLDQATAELQQLSEKITRAVILPATSEQSPEEVVQAIYASRNAAELSAQAASIQAAEAHAHALEAENSEAQRPAAPRQRPFLPQKQRLLLAVLPRVWMPQSKKSRCRVRAWTQWRAVLPPFLPPP